jgi:hypothetical protein
MSLTIVESLPGENQMKKLVFIGLVLVSTAAGCGHGWLPFRGAMCRQNCVGGMPANNGCQDCNSGYAGYEGYEGGQVIDGGYGSPMVPEQYCGSVAPQTNVAPPMTGIPGRQ